MELPKIEALDGFCHQATASVSFDFDNAHHIVLVQLSQEGMLIEEIMSFTQSGSMVYYNDHRLARIENAFVSYLYSYCEGSDIIKQIDLLLARLEIPKEERNNKK